MNTKQWESVKKGLESRYQKVIQACKARDAQNSYRTQFVEYGDFLAKSPALRERAKERANHYHRQIQTEEIGRRIGEMADAWEAIARKLMANADPEALRMRRRWMFQRRGQEKRTAEERLNKIIERVQQYKRDRVFHCMAPVAGNAEGQGEFSGENWVVDVPVYDTICRRPGGGEDYETQEWSDVSVDVSEIAGALGLSMWRNLCQSELETYERCCRVLVHELETRWKEGGGLALFKVLWLRRIWQTSPNAGDSDESLLEPFLPYDHVEMSRMIHSRFGMDGPDEVEAVMTEAHAALMEWIDEQIAASVQEGTESSAPRGLGMDIPANARWSDVSITFVSDADVRVKVSDRKAEEFTFERMQMADTRGGKVKPGRLWTTLRLFACCNGFVKVKEDDPNRRVLTEKEKKTLVKDVSRLRRKLKELLPIDGEAITHDQKKGAYQTEFKIGLADTLKGHMDTS